jgi:2-iminobutanoate/2-iminopropanoate deaminase
MSNSFETYNPEGIYRPASYNHALRAGDTLYVAGQVARDASGNLVGTSAGEQAEQVYANLAAVLAAAGASFADVVKVTTYLVDSADSQAVSEVRLRHFAEHRPPHTGLVVAALGAADVKVEVEVIAVLTS